MRGANHQRGRAVRIGHTHAHGLTAQAHVHDLPEGLPVDRERHGGALRADRPRRDPVAAVRLIFGECRDEAEDRGRQHGGDGGRQPSTGRQEVLHE